MTKSERIEYWNAVYNAVKSEDLLDDFSCTPGDKAHLQLHSRHLDGTDRRDVHYEWKLTDDGRLKLGLDSELGTFSASAGRIRPVINALDSLKTDFPTCRAEEVGKSWFWVGCDVSPLPLPHDAVVLMKNFVRRTWPLLHPEHGLTLTDAT